MTKIARNASAATTAATIPRTARPPMLTIAAATIPTTAAASPSKIAETIGSSPPAA